MKQIDHPALYPDLPERDYAPNAYVRLRPEEKLFVEAYLSTLASSAAAAGKAIVDMLGSKHEIDNTSRAAALLQRPAVKQAIFQRAREMSAKFEISTDRLLKEVASIAFANMANYVHIGADGEPVIDLSNCTYEQMSAISEITVEDYTEGRGEMARDVRKIKLKLHDKQNAQDKLMKFLQLYAPERHEVNINVKAQNITVDMTPEQLADIYKAKLGQL